MRRPSRSADKHMGSSMTTQRIQTVLVGIALAALAITPSGCKSEAPAPAPPAAKAAAAPAKDAAPAAEPAAAEVAAPAAGAVAPAKVDPTPAPKPAGEPAAAATTDAKRDVLGKAYVEAYCAQRAGETEKLLDIYTRYGFEEPKQWTAAWTEAAKDSAWVAQITQDAIRKCP